MTAPRRITARYAVTNSGRLPRKNATRSPLRKPLAARLAAILSDTVDVRVAEVEVLVTDRDGRPVSGLTPADFQVIEDGQPVEVTNLYTTAAQPMVLAVFFDDMSLGSGSRVAALNGLRQLFASNLKPGDRVLFVRYSGNVEIQGEPTGDLAALEAILDRIGKSAPRGMMIQQERSMLQREILQGTPPGGEGALMQVAEGQAA